MAYQHIGVDMGHGVSTTGRRGPNLDTYTLPLTESIEAQDLTFLREGRHLQGIQDLSYIEHTINIESDGKEYTFHGVRFHEKEPKNNKEGKRLLSKDY